MAACNCGSFHGGNAMQRLHEIEEVLPWANGPTILERVQTLVSERKQAIADCDVFISSNGSLTSEVLELRATVAALSKALEIAASYLSNSVHLRDCQSPHDSDFLPDKCDCGLQAARVAVNGALTSIPSCAQQIAKQLEAAREVAAEWHECEFCWDAIAGTDMAKRLAVLSEAFRPVGSGARR
ncbi:MAG TPA: hypothetical protein VGM43_16565 [Bryobacteraceae bacterium]|jgi:hypothetical protein